MAGTCSGCGATGGAGTSPKRSLCDPCVCRISRFVLAGSENAALWPWVVQSPGRPAGSTDASSRTHLDLGLAYLQMQLFEDALAEAALAVAMSPERAVIEEAWVILAEPRLAPELERLHALASALARARA